MLDQLIAKSEASDLKTSAPEPEKKFTYEVLDARLTPGEVGSKAPSPSPSPTWSFGNIPLFPRDGASNCAKNMEEPEQKDGPAANHDGDTDVKGADRKGAHDARTCDDKKCSLCASGGEEQHEHGKDRARAGHTANDAAPAVAKNKCAANNGEAACNCKKCSGSDLGTRAFDDPPAPAPGGAAPPPAAPAFTYTFIDRESYGETSGNFTAPRCLPGGSGSAVLQAGVARPVVTVFPNGTYSVRRNDGVNQTATCRRLAAGLAATRTHENSHAAGARRGAAEGNRVARLPRNFATAAECTSQAPGIIATYQAALDPIWTNEITHGPGTLPPTAATFAQENAAGTCTFA